MRTLSLSLLVVIIMVMFLTSGCGSSNNDEKSIQATATIEAYEKTREATIEAFVTYRQDKERLLGIFPLSKYYKARKDALNLIDLRDVDEELKTFFSVLNDEFQDSHRECKKAEEEAVQLGLTIRNNPAEAGTVIVEGLTQKASDDFSRKWEKSMEKIRMKRTAEEKELLKKLSERYDYPFYEAVFGE